MISNFFKSRPVLIVARQFFRCCPDKLFSAIFTAVSNHLMRGQSLDSVLSTLEGKCVRLGVIDANVQCLMRIKNACLVSADSADWDVSICGNLADFQALIHGDEDADTLFFQRRLELQGDTEVGLVLKNMLDALEYDLPSHLESVLGKPTTTLLRQLPFANKVIS